MRRRQQGALGAIVVVILALLMTAFLAVFALSRVKSNSGSGQDTVVALSAAADALDQFASVNKRLPCPANPALETGLEMLPGAGAATCSFPAGTLPWQTLGLKRESGYDAWGMKISYRVYTGNKGSLTQPNGVDMVNCDLTETGGASGDVTPVAGSAGGLCVTGALPIQRTSLAATFLDGKGLPLRESGVDRVNVAYILISHGSTGYGGFTASGDQRELPKNEELDHTRANGPFVIRAFSDSDTEATSNVHFDDLLLYRTLPDVAKRAGLTARDWDDLTVGSALLNAPNIAAALGQGSVSPGDLGVSTLSIGGVQISGFGAGGSAANLSLGATTTGTSVDGIGIFGTNALMSSIAGEYLKFAFVTSAGRFAVTLADFGTYTFVTAFTERVEFRFFMGSSPVASVTKSACRADGGLASYTMTVATFDSVEIRPLAASSAFGNIGLSALLVSEVKACVASGPACTTSLAQAANDCP